MIYIVAGIPGSGKSTWINAHRNINKDYWCSRDNIRFGILGEGEAYFAKEDKVYKEWIKSIKYAINQTLLMGGDIYIDATHLTPKARNKVLNQLDFCGHGLTGVNFLTDEEECIRRNNLRTGRAQVPESVIRNMAETFIPIAQNENYVYDEIIEVKD